MPLEHRMPRTSAFAVTFHRDGLTAVPVDEADMISLKIVSLYDPESTENGYRFYHIQ